MSTFKEANALYRAGAYRDALDCYLEVSERHGWAALMHANINLCRKRLGFAIDAPEIIVTLTTIHSRLPYVPQVVKSLINQTLQPVRIHLNISHEPYLLDAGIAADNPILLELMKLPRLQINWVANTGPYRKIWHFLEGHFSQPEAQDRLFVTVDDDTLYPEYFLQRLYKKYLQHDCIIAFRGRHIEVEQQTLSPYDRWTWGQDQSSLKNLPTGKDGILYNTKFFTKDFLNMAEAISHAPTADDLWIKWHCALNGVPAVILNPEACTSDYKSFPVVNFDKTYRNVSLYAHHNSSSAQNKNNLTVQALESFYEKTYGYNLAWLIKAESGDLL